VSQLSVPHPSKRQKLHDDAFGFSPNRIVNADNRRIERHGVSEFLRKSFAIIEDNRAVIRLTRDQQAIFVATASLMPAARHFEPGIDRADFRQ